MPDRDLAQPPPAQQRPVPRPAGAMIARKVLVAGEAFGAGMPARRVSEAIARGLRAGGLPEPDLCPLIAGEQEDADASAQPKALLDALGFDARMRSSRAVVLAAARLSEPTLAASIAFEIATRARQAGVPAYAITAANELDAFDARILDLQLILEATGARALTAAANKLAAVI